MKTKTCLLSIAFGLLASSAFSATLSGFGTAIVDGEISAGEWNTAAVLSFTANTPDGGSAPATLFAMNDDVNLYLALEFIGTFNQGSSVGFAFPNTASPASGVDSVSSWWTGPTPYYSDKLIDLFPICPVTPCSMSDTNLGGTNDGFAAWKNTSNTVFELRKPLSSGDPNDFDLSIGDTTGLDVGLVLYDSSGRSAGTDLLGNSVEIVPFASPPAIPLPATIPLLACALGSLVVLRQRWSERSPNSLD